MGSLLPAVKLGMAVLAGIPVSKIANDIIKNNVTIVTKMDQVKVVTGSIVIGAMLSQQVSKTTDMFVDAVVNLKKHTETEDSEEIVVEVDES
jgi:NADPH-dependent glutamate synthase beta subunit-like oxidoreductase